MSNNQQRRKLSLRQENTNSASLTDYFPVQKRPSTTKANPKSSAKAGNNSRDSDKENSSPQNCSTKASRSKLAKSPDRKRRRLTFVRKDIAHPFADLPLELGFQLLEFTKLTDISRLAFVDTKSRNVVLDYLKSQRFVERARRLLDGLGEATAFRNVAKIFKRTTMVLPTWERVQILHRFVNNIVKFETLDVEGAKLWGRLWHEVMRGWEFGESSKAYFNLLNSNLLPLKKNFAAAFNSGPGNAPEQEYQLHVFLRWFLLDHPFVSKEDYGFWLATVLNQFSIFHQAVLLYLLFGPVDHILKRIDWKALSSRAVTMDLMDDFFAKVYNALRHLRAHSPSKWTNDTVISLVEELTSIPDGWLLENFAGLMLFCDESVKTGLLTSRVINGHSEEVCHLFFSMCIWLRRRNKDMGSMVRLFRNLMNEIGDENLKKELIRKFAGQLSVRLSDIHMPFEANQNLAHELSAYEQFFGLIMFVAARSFSTPFTGNNRGLEP